MASVSKRSSMALYSDPKDHYSHRVRIVMEEKGIASDIIYTEVDELDDDLLALIPHRTLPVLVDRDVCLYDSVTLMEYLDERFPHPPLLPVYPVARAQIRLFIQRIERDWCVLFDSLFNKDLSAGEEKKAKQKLKSHFLSTVPIFKEKDFFMSDEFTIVDCCIAPIMWRLPFVGINLEEKMKTRPLHQYMKRVFTRPAFIKSLSELERDMRSI